MPRQRTRRTTHARVLLTLTLVACGAEPANSAPAPSATNLPEASDRPLAELGEAPTPPADSNANVPSAVPVQPATSAPLPALPDALPAAREPGSSRGDEITGSAAESGPCALLARGGEGLRELRVGSATRSYLVHVPELASGAAPVPLLIDLHGLLTHADYQRARSGFVTLSDQAGFVVVHPNAVDSAWNLGPCCTATPMVDDLGFVRALVAELARTGCIDRSRIYAAGVAAGGGLAQQLACQSADVFAAVASRDFDLLEETAASCNPTRPIAVSSTRSMNDPTMPYVAAQLRPTNGLNVTIHPLGALASFQRWAAINRCKGSPQMVANGCQLYSSCDAGVEVELCQPSQSAAQDSERAWRFLQRFTLSWPR